MLKEVREIIFAYYVCVCVFVCLYVFLRDQMPIVKRNILVIKNLRKCL